MAKVSRENADYILGREHRKTPAYNMQTLTLPKLYPVKSINRAKPEFCKHLSFSSPDPDISKSDFLKWVVTIKFFLDADYWCTLEIHPSHWNYLQKSPLVDYPRFILLVKLSLANINKAGYNTCIVIDDAEFGGSNGGVWTHDLHDLRQRQYFTRWDESMVDQHREFGLFKAEPSESE
jgi:hypothetical protein